MQTGSCHCSTTSPKFWQYDVDFGPRLVSQKGIPGLRKRAKDLKLKGKGHEVSVKKGLYIHSNGRRLTTYTQWRDAARILSFYQEWLDDLFPKAKFLDALAMVEKIGHTKALHEIRTNLIDESRPKSSTFDEGDEGDAAETEQQEADALQRQPGSMAPRSEKPSSNRAKTPDRNDWLEDDIYNATPTANRKKDTATETQDGPDDDELDALMAQTGGSTPQNKPDDRPVRAGFSAGKPNTMPSQPDDEDDLDALMAEAEAEQSSRKEPPAIRAAGDDDMDDLDALMAEAEAQSAPSKSAGARESGAKPPDFDDEEEAMAEMDGLW